MKSFQTPRGMVVLEMYPRGKASKADLGNLLKHNAHHRRRDRTQSFRSPSMNDL
jgi:hypothetical protein